MADYKAVLDIASQILINVFGITSIILVAKNNRWGFVLGLMAQPFWFVLSAINNQWGIFFVSIPYTLSWCFGVYERFFKKQPQPVQQQ